MVAPLGPLLGLLLTTAPPQETLTPEATEAPRLLVAVDRPLRFTMREETRLEATEVTSSMNGSSHTSKDFNPVTTMVTQQAWTDVVDALDDAGTKPLRVRRLVEQGDQRVLLEITERRKPKEGRTAISHPAEGAVVVFEPAEEGGALAARDASAPADAAPADWAPAMALAPTGAALLPKVDGDTLEVGTSWEVEPASVARFLDPMGLSPQTFPAMPGLEDPDLYARYGQLSLTRAAVADEGEVRAKWMGLQTAPDGRRFGRIELAVKLSGTAETTDWMIAQSKPYEMAAIGAGAKDAHIDVTLEGVARVLWDMERGHWAEFHLAADVVADFQQDYAFDMRGTEFSGALALTFEGTTEFEILAAPGKPLPAEKR